MHHKVIHYHLAKTGGTTLNTWLDTLVPSCRARPAERGDQFRFEYRDAASWFRTLFRTSGTREIGIDGLNTELGRDARAYWDVIHDHCPGVVTSPGAAYQFVVLRNPIDRCLSLLRDWRRLTEADVAAAPRHEREMRQAAKELSIDEFIGRFGDHPLFIDYLQNQQACSLRDVALHALPQHSIAACEAATRGQSRRAFDLALAKAALLEVFDLVGVTESLNDVACSIARDLGAAPPPELDRHNATTSDRAREPISEKSTQRLAELNQDDEILYRLAQERCKESCLQPYDEAAFEAGPLPIRLAQLSPKRLPSGRVFSMNDQIVGSGFHGRDARDTDAVNVWTGPGTRSVLYVPVPADEDLLIFLNVGGYMENAAAGFPPPAVLMCCDGREMPFHRTASTGHYERIVMPVRSTREFVKVEIILSHAWTASEIGHDPGDVRRRGLGLMGYGYSLASRPR